MPKSQLFFLYFNSQNAVKMTIKYNKLYAKLKIGTYLDHFVQTNSLQSQNGGTFEYDEFSVFVDRK